MPTISHQGREFCNQPQMTQISRKRDIPYLSEASVQSVQSVAPIRRIESWERCVALCRIISDSAGARLDEPQRKAKRLRWEPSSSPRVADPRSCSDPQGKVTLTISRVIFTQNQTERFTSFHLVSPCFTYGKNFASGSSADGPAVRPYRRVPASSIQYPASDFGGVSFRFTLFHLVPL